MLDVLSYRDVMPADIWDEVRDWLDEHAVLVPAAFTPEPLPRRQADRRPAAEETTWSSKSS
ncbi:MAG: hypothetical protein ACT4OK_13135 [Gemmobacter sp.]